MQAVIRSRAVAYAPPHRVTLWATLVPALPDEEYEIHAEIPGSPPAWFGGVENTWLPARMTLRCRDIRPNVRLLDLPARGLPVGWYSVTLYAANVQIAQCRFFVGGPCSSSLSTVADMLGGQVDQMRAAIAANFLDPDIKLDETNSIIGTWADVRERIDLAYPGLPGGVAYRADNLYRLPSLQFTRFLAAISGISARRFVGEEHDCDDYAFAKTGWLHHPSLSHGAWGPLWGRFAGGGGAHAMVGVATHDAGFRLLEPQNGTVIGANDKDRPGDPWRPYVLMI
jgi:hypothetical protein